MKNAIQYGSWICVLLAVLAWWGIWTMGNDILDEASSRASNAFSATQASDRAAYTQRLSALVADTQNDRNTLENVTNMGIISIVTAIESVGQKTGVTIKVDNAQPQGNVAALPNGANLNEFAFVIESDGSFAALMNTIQTLSTLPFPSTIEQVELMRNSDTGSEKGAWHLNARIGVLTTLNAS